MADILLEGISRLYGTKAAVDDVHLHIKDGEFVSLLGPSGCGKSTTLAMIAGLDKPTRGQIVIGSELVARAGGEMVLPEHRNLGLVPQTYALWPHMIVADNVGFPLKVRGVPRAERRRRVDEALNLVEMAALGGRYPHELSGGQQQRVAVARTLVYRPRVLLLDEPLSNLDAKLRERARLWLRSLQQELKITTIFVTHDQGEALSLSDRIAVMDAGKLAQVGTPEEIYRKPANLFVADFVGNCSFLLGRVACPSTDGWIKVAVPDAGELVIPVPDNRFAVGDEVSLAVRPEALSAETGAGSGGVDRLRVKIRNAEFSGNAYAHFADVGGQAIRFNFPSELVGEVTLACNSASVVTFPAQLSH